MPSLVELLRVTSLTSPRPPHRGNLDIITTERAYQIKPAAMHTAGSLTASAGTLQNAAFALQGEVRLMVG